MLSHLFGGSNGCEFIKQNFRISQVETA